MANYPIEKAWHQHFGEESAQVKVVQAPGRVNVLGEHTDYNEGFVFPAAIDKYINMAGGLREDREVRIYSVDLHEEAAFSLDNIVRNEAQPWVNYLTGVMQLVEGRGHTLRGMNLAVAGNIPLGAGLSSSAALEMATAYMLQALHGFALPPMETVRLCQRTENEFVGVNCGIMDQYISCLGQAGHALLIDCRSLDYTSVPLLESGVKLVITNSKVKHNLIDSAYNQRRQECEEAVAFFTRTTGEEKRSLRDVTLDEFKAHREAMPEALRKRTEHVINENQRVLDGVEALRKGDLSQFGALMYQSHFSLKDLYEVSCRELDILVMTSRMVEGVYGSRMTGGGFGGCMVSLARAEVVETLITYVEEKYRAKTGITPEFYICDVVDGAERLNAGKI